MKPKAVSNEEFHSDSHLIRWNYCKCRHHKSSHMIKDGKMICESQVSRADGTSNQCECRMFVVTETDSYKKQDMKETLILIFMIALLALSVMAAMWIFKWVSNALG